MPVLYACDPNLEEDMFWGQDAGSCVELPGMHM